MTEMQTVSKILTLLSSSEDFVSKLDKTADGTPMLIFSPLVPEEWSIKAKTANMYVAGSTRQIEYSRYYFSMSCRAETYVESRELAFALHSALNRMYVDDMFVVTTVSQTIRPFDAELDNFNTPVDILVRSI